MLKHLVVLTGAGISAESGLDTFRGQGGLWHGHNIYEVATPEAWRNNPQLVLDFYNERRRKLVLAQPNQAHIDLAQLQAQVKVTIITQNVDNLHGRAGSMHVLHLHGELLKVRSTHHDHLVYDWTSDLHLGDLAADGHQLRPHIVWFGEEVPLLPQAVAICGTADLCWIIGTSLLVYPAAGLIRSVPCDCPIWYIDPAEVNPFKLPLDGKHLYHIQSPATMGVESAISRLRNSYL